jgi:uncharacterized protein
MGATNKISDRSGWKTRGSEVLLHFAASAAKQDSKTTALLFHISFLLWLMPRCPTCGKPGEWKDNPWRPFCSERCKLIDFDKWISEEYRVPGRHVNPVVIAEESPKSTGNATEDDES